MQELPVKAPTAGQSPPVASSPAEAGPIYQSQSQLAGDTGTAALAPLQVVEDQLWHNRQIGTGYGAPWTGWNYFTHPANRAKQVSVSNNPDGRMHAFMIGMDDQVWHNDQIYNTPDSPWTGWNYLGEAGNKAKQLIVVPNADGRLHAFMIGMDDQLWHNEQWNHSAGSPWTGWTYLSEAGHRAKSLVVMRNLDRSLHAFMIGLDDQLWQNSPLSATAGSAWTGWTYLSEAGSRAKSLVVVPNGDGRLHAFMIGMDDQLWHNDQLAVGTGKPWTGWNYLSQPGNRAKSLVVVPNGDGRLHAFMIGMDDQLWHNDQFGITLGSAWTGWNYLSVNGNRAKNLLVVPNADGRLHAFMIGMDDQLWHNDQMGRNAGSPWTGWNYLSHSGDRAKRQFVVPNLDGRLHAFMIGMDDQVWHNDQSGTEIGSAWTGWTWLSLAGDRAKNLTIRQDSYGQLRVLAIGISRADGGAPM